MARDDRSSPLTQGKGRTDEVDASKGVFPFGAPHPPGAEERTPGELGGGPYQESGRGGPATSLEVPIPPEEGAEIRSAGPGEAAEERETEEERAPKGALPSHAEQAGKKG